MSEENENVHKARLWLQAAPGRHAIKIGRYWCVKSEKELDSPQDNICMDGSVTPIRTNSVKKELEEYPERCTFIRIDGIDADKHKYTAEVVCPWCGYVHGDSWEMGEGKQECHFCNQKFEMERDVTVHYNTSRCD